jgi:hypothetical protein
MAISLVGVCGLRAAGVGIADALRPIMNEAPPPRPEISGLRPARNAALRRHAMGAGRDLKISPGFRYLIDIPAF